MDPPHLADRVGKTFVRQQYVVAAVKCGKNRQVELREILMPNKSPMRWPKSVGGFHLPSAVCPPSVFGRTAPCSAEALEGRRA